MKINKELAHYDPSRYTVYQMIDYTKSIQKIKLIQKKLKNLYLFKTQPFVNSLYNYVHILNKNFSKKDLIRIQAFFGKNIHRIKFPEDQNIEQILLSSGYKFKDSSYIMISDVSNDYELLLPEKVKIIKVNNRETINDYKLIFSETFGCSLEETNQKFGFFDNILINPEDNHINMFILYENEIPASIGGYYAFDNFSIENIGTKKEFRGKGYAHIIINFLLQEAEKLKYKKACLVASEKGSHVYKNMGFKITNKNNTFIVNS